MIASLFWGIVARTGQIAAESSTTLLCGLLVAGIMRRMMGAEGTRRLFGGPGWRGLLRRLGRWHPLAGLLAWRHPDCQRNASRRRA